MRQFSCEEEPIFPKSLENTWQQQSKDLKYRPPRDELIQALKEKKLIEQRYANNELIKEESDRRQSILDYLTLQIHESVSNLRHLADESEILAYKASLEDPKNK